MESVTVLGYSQGNTVEAEPVSYYLLSSLLLGAAATVAVPLAMGLTPLVFILAESQKAASQKLVSLC